MATEELKSIISTFREIANRPEVYLNPSADLAKDTAQVVKILFDLAKRDESHGSRCVNTCPLQELLIENFNDEQIWQEIELQNEPLLATLTTEVRSMEVKKRKLTVLQPIISFVGKDEVSHEKKRQRFQENQVKDDESVENDQGFSSEERVTAEQGDTDTDEDLNDEITHKTRKPKQRSMVDDNFFKLADMLEFLDKEDRRYEQAQAGKKAGSENSDEDDESVDLFAEMNSEEEEDDNEDWDNAVDTTAKLMGRNTLPTRQHLKVKPAAELKYADFFDPPEEEERKEMKRKQREGEEKKDNKEENDDDDEEDEEEDEDKMNMEEDINTAASTLEDESDDKTTIKDSESVSTFEKTQQKASPEIQTKRIREEVQEEAVYQGALTPSVQRKGYSVM